MPQFYEIVLGVTGTLQEGRLPVEARDVLRDEIHIKHMTYCPSMYATGSAGVRSWDPASEHHVKLTSQTEHFVAITNEIDKRLKPTDANMKGERSVLVFFESASELEAYYESSYFKRYHGSANRLTETSAKEPEEREALVEKATRQGQVTLATRSFGRGIDFVVDDEHMLTCGGLHVLLTFLPRDVQEEVQIMGRCARQGAPGSFSMILRCGQLEDLAGDKATPEDIQKWHSDGVLYAKMSEIRSAIATADMKERLDKAKEAKGEHDEVAKALNAFSAKGDPKPLSTLLKRYNWIGQSTTSRTLMMIDVTCSMNSLIEKTKTCIGTFFDRVQKVLDHEGIESGFELQIVAYSNYNVLVDEILEASTWEAKPHNLARFLSGLDTRGGWGPEAIELGLMHALLEHQKRPINQIIVIGDAGANSMANINHNRACGLKDGDAYWDAQRPVWSPTGIPKMEAVNVLNSIQAVHPVPIHCYHMASRAKGSFEQLAAATVGGTAQKLDVNSSSGAQLLTDAVCKQILSSLGGKALEDAYERMKPSFSR